MKTEACLYYSHRTRYDQIQTLTKPYNHRAVLYSKLLHILPASLTRTMSLPITLHNRSISLLSRQLRLLTSFRKVQQQCHLSSSSPGILTRPLVPQKPLPIPPKDYTPEPLNRPIGQASPPQQGQNTGIDTRNWRQRRDDFFDYDKHLVRRRQLYSPPFL